MAITVVNSYSYGYAGGERGFNYTGIDPAFTHAVDDLLIVFGYTDQTTPGGNMSISGGSGSWTEVYDAGQAGGRGCSYFMAWKLVTNATTEDAATYTWADSGTSNEEALFQIIQLRGVDTTTPLDIASNVQTFSDTGTHTSRDPASVTTATDGAVVISSIWTNGNDVTAYTPPTGYTEVEDVIAVHANGALAYKEVATAGSEDASEWVETNENNHDEAVIITAVARPASTGSSYTRTADLSASASVAATGSVVHYGAADLSASASVAATGSVVHYGTADLAGSASVAATGSVVHYGTAALSASASVAATGQRLTYGTADLNGSASVAATGGVIKFGTAALTGSASVAATGGRTARGTVDLAGSASVSATGQRTGRGTVGLAGSATVAATGSVVRHGTAALTGSATLAATGSAGGTGTADLTGSATVAATGSVVRHGTAALTASASVTVIDTHAARYAVAALAASATLSATGTGAGPVGSATITPPLRAVTRPRGHDPFDTMLRRIHRKGYYP